MKKLLLILLISTSMFGENNTTKPLLDKSDKVILTNVAMGAVSLTWGLTQWDYGSANPGLRDEGWFGIETSNGGADKLGHFYTNYLTTRIFSPLFKYWGYSTHEAALYGAITSAIQSVIFVEMGDSTSKGYGFSYQDALMDILGSVVGYFWETNPALSDTIDFRVEYAPDFSKPIQSDFTTDYQYMKHLMVFKAEGITNIPVLEYMELHVGYYARNFFHNSGPIEDRERYMYVGLGLNLSKLTRPVLGKYSQFFNYYQTPYTYISYDKDLDQ